MFYYHMDEHATKLIFVFDVRYSDGYEDSEVWSLYVENYLFDEDTDKEEMYSILKDYYSFELDELEEKRDCEILRLDEWEVSYYGQ